MEWWFSKWVGCSWLLKNQANPGASSMYSSYFEVIFSEQCTINDCRSKNVDCLDLINSLCKQIKEFKCKSDRVSEK